MKTNLLFSFFVLFSLNCFAQWSQINNGIANLSLGATLLGNSDDYIFCGTINAGKMYRSNDFGSNWNEISPPVPSNMPQCGYNFNNKYYAGLNSSMDCIYYTSDNGTSWNVGIGGPTTTVVRGFIDLPYHIYAYTSTKGIYQSTDNGANWSAVNNGLSNLNITSMATFDDKLIAASIGGGVYISTDYGANWVQSNNGIGSSTAGILVWQMDTKLYYTAQGGDAFVSTDKGTSWTVLTSLTRPAAFGLNPAEIFRNNGHLYMKSRFFASGGLKDSIFYSSNEGQSWNNISANLLSTDLSSERLMEFKGYAFICYNLVSPNKGIYRRDISVNTIPICKVKPGYNIFPDPAHNVTHAISDQSILGVEYNIVDMNGMTLIKSQFSDETGSIDLSILPAGIYFINISKDGTQTFKLIKI